MNLAQLVDLDRVLAERDKKPDKPAPRPAMGIVEHRCRYEDLDPDSGAAPKYGKRNSLRGRVRAVLAAASNPLSAREVHAVLPDLPFDGVRNVLNQLATCAEVESAGVYGQSVYTLSNRGRAIIERTAPAAGEKP